MKDTEMKSITKIEHNHLPALKIVLESIDLFPPEVLDDMTHDFLNNPKTEDLWFTYADAGIPVAIGYCAPEKLTIGTYNLYAIGVRSDLQGKGIGKQMMNYLEGKLSEKGGRILIVETSGSEEFKRTRKFYTDLNYKKEATIRDFWEEGDDKVIFWKKLN